MCAKMFVEHVVYFDQGMFCTFQMLVYIVLDLLCVTTNYILLVVWLEISKNSLIGLLIVFL